MKKSLQRIITHFFKVASSDPSKVRAVLYKELDYLILRSSFYDTSQNETPKSIFTLVKKLINWDKRQTKILNDLKKLSYHYIVMYTTKHDVLHTQGSVRTNLKFPYDSASLKSSSLLFATPFLYLIRFEIDLWDRAAKKHHCLYLKKAFS